MKVNKDFRKAEPINSSDQVKGKIASPKEKNTKQAIFREIEEDEEIGYLDLKKRDSISNYFDDEDEFDEDEFDDEDDEEFNDD